MSHINYAFNPEDDALPRDKMKLRNIASTKYSGDWPSIPHSHSYAELFYIVDGEGQFQINDKLFPVQAHQLVVVNPNVIHTEVSFESHPLEYIVLGIEGLEFTISDAAEGSFCIYTFKEDNDVLVCMRKILREMQNRESSFQILCQAYMDIIVVQLMRNASVSAVPIHSRLPANRQCATVKRYIDHHYKENITLDQLAEKVSITKYYMVHAFKREYAHQLYHQLPHKRRKASPGRDGPFSLSDRSYSGLFFFQLLLPNFPQCRRNLANRVPESKPGEILTFVFV